MEASCCAACVRRLQIAARVVQVNDIGVGRVDGKDWKATRTEAASTGVDAEDTTSSLSRGASATLDNREHAVRKGRSTIGRLGDLIGDACRTAGAGERGGVSPPQP